MKYKIPKNAKIISIKEDSIIDTANGYKQYYEGLVIETDRGNIKLVITNGQNCCENWGNLFFETPDNISKFIGATILEVQDIDIKRDSNIDNETQLRITTDVGTIQYAIYNEHNGYYSHGTIIQVFDSTKYDLL